MRIGTPLQFVSWVRACVTLPKFSVMINGSLEGFFSWFHDRCERMGLTHLVFADDLMIFYAAERDSMEFVRQVLVEFAGLFGSVANVGKTSMFVEGVESGEVEELTAFMGFSLGSLPVRYLDLPLLVDWLRVVDCAPLIQRITTHIRSWAARSLSFAGRLQLVSYLWKGSVAIRSEVGRSWCLKAILRSRDRFKHLVRLMVGDDRTYFVWWDLWLSEGAILDSYGSTMVYDVGSSLEARLSEFMDGEGGWRWPTMSWELLEIWGLIQAVRPRVKGEDY
ncbi:uncharacterized protein LOC120090644 [Benincasa hispida]|uniref:uncharacterized protein LOC120090644 n=1 Tax=Benincasa hispida TaxID=102211 RepID=UPI001900AF40|nr:uncharacterized protein LOC120090644 [Benincasa hispida]